MSNVMGDCHCGCPHCCQPRQADEKDERIMQRWREAVERADPEKVTRMLAHLDAQAAAQEAIKEARRNVDPPER